MSQDELIKSLELQLVSPQFRKNRDQLNKLLADEFVEIGTSGKKYLKQDVIESLPDEKPTWYELTDFEFRQLSGDCTLVTYQAETIEQPSHRCSIWINRSGRWQLLYHQSTPL